MLMVASGPEALTLDLLAWHGQSLGDFSSEKTSTWFTKMPRENVEQKCRNHLFVTLQIIKLPRRGELKGWIFPDLVAFVKDSVLLPLL